VFVPGPQVFFPPPDFSGSWNEVSTNSIRWWVSLFPFFSASQVSYISMLFSVPNSLKDLLLNPS